MFDCSHGAAISSAEALRQPDIFGREVQELLGLPRKLGRFCFDAHGAID